MGENKFEWNDKTVREFVEFGRDEHFLYFSKGTLAVDNGLEKFKQSKTIPLDYEILKYIAAGGIPHIWLDGMCNADYCKPHSVKRLSDGEIFTIGDAIEYVICGGHNMSGTIERFEKVGDIMFAFGNPDLFSVSIQDLLKIKLIIFTTYDGYKVTNENDLLWVVWLDIYTIQCSTAKQCDVWLRADKNIECFNEENNAKEYVLMNKPCLSISNILAGCPPDWATHFTIGLATLKQLAQSKIDSKQ